MRKRSLLSIAFRSSLAIFSIVGLMWIVYGDKGLLHAYRLKKELGRVNEDNERLKQENESLLREIETLRNDKQYIEKIAREELGMSKKGEIVFVFGQGGKSPTPATVHPVRKEYPSELSHGVRPPRTIERAGPPGSTP